MTINLIKFKARVESIDEHDIVDLSCGIHFKRSVLDFEVEEGKEYEFTLTGDSGELHEARIVLSDWITSVEGDDINENSRK